MTHYYAQLDKDGFVKAVTQTASYIAAVDMVRIDFLDESILGFKYENGNFFDARQADENA